VQVWRPKMSSLIVPVVDGTMRFEPGRAAE
jgi:hypothetical protein